jgi:hypothetical protein
VQSVPSPEPEKLFLKRNHNLDKIHIILSLNFEFTFFQEQFNHFSDIAHTAGHFSFHAHSGEAGVTQQFDLITSLKADFLKIKTSS